MPSPSALVRQAWGHAISILNSLSLAVVVLNLNHSGEVATFGRNDLEYNFVDGTPGIYGLPFRVSAWSAQGSIYEGKPAPLVSGTDGATTEDCAGKFSVTVRWTRGTPPAEANRAYADITIANHLDTPILEFTLQLLGLRFPSPIAANDGNPTLRAHNSGSPGILFANYGGPLPGALACDFESVDASRPLMMKLERQNAASTQAMVVVMNHHDYEDGGSPYLYSPIPAKGTIHFRIGFRFLPPAPDPMAACGDLFAAFAQKYPLMQNVRAWQDRRPIAQIFLAGDNTNHGLNPRKWFDASRHINVTTPGGVKRFQRMILDLARETVKRMKSMNAQGVITWDIEGAQFPNATYMGDPTKLATPDPAQSVAPEMAAIVDQYFKIYRDAGYRVGVTIRPQKVMFERDAAGRIVNAWEFEDDWHAGIDPPANLEDFWQQQLEAKIRFARERWGATIFYIDSNGAPGSPVSFLVMRNLAAEFPDVLLIPEQSTMGYYSACAPYRQLNMLAPNNIMSPLVRETYPGADGRSPCFGVINPTIDSMNRCWPQLVREVRAGDILFFRDGTTIRSWTRSAACMRRRKNRALELISTEARQAHRARRARWPR